ncbi:unnamed protein product, partial [Porites lobata]
SEISEESNSKPLGPRKVQLLISVWKEYFPISKRRNSSVSERISKQLNQMLPGPKQNLRCVRTLQQCKAKIKNLEDEFKRIKDHNNKSGNDRITFPYFDDINAVLGCKPGDF